MFKVGDKVVFIDDDPRAAHNEHFNIRLEKDNKIYTILSPYVMTYGGYALLTLEETGECMWCCCSFRKVEEDFGEQVLSNIKEQIEEDELVLI